MRNLLIAAAVVVMLVPPVSGQIPAPAAPKVQLRFEDGGTVTLSATGATIREVLAEWTRKGGTVFVGAERLPATPLTLQYDHRPEAEVAASLLRNAAGFVIGPRREGASSASSIEIVVILAASTASAANNPPPPLYPNGETAPSPGQGRPACAGCPAPSGGLAKRSGRRFNTSDSRATPARGTRSCQIRSWPPRSRRRRRPQPREAGVVAEGR